MVTDVAGFAAASYHRGIAVVHVPTTLLGMVDAAIGGKTGVNLPEGKNLVGAFWQPAAVLCDTDLLATLPEREWRCGHGEMAKYHFLTGDDLLALPLEERIARCVAIKAAVVAADPEERDRRRGPRSTTATPSPTPSRSPAASTSATAKRSPSAWSSPPSWPAVLGRIDDARVAEHRRVVGAYELSAALPAGLDHDELLALMARDKKAVTGSPSCSTAPAAWSWWPASSPPPSGRRWRAWRGPGDARSCSCCTGRT